MSILRGFERTVADAQSLLLAQAKTTPISGIIGPSAHHLVMPGLGRLGLRYYPASIGGRHRIVLTMEQERAQGDGTPGPAGWTELCAAIASAPDGQAYVPGLGLWQGKTWFMSSRAFLKRLDPGKFPFEPDDMDLRAPVPTSHDVADRVWDTLCVVDIPFSIPGLELLREVFHEDQLDLRTITWFVAEARSGGLSQFFRNPTGNIQPHVLRALRKIGDKETLALLQAASRIYFGDEFPPGHSVRRYLLERIDEAKHEEVGELDQRFVEHSARPEFYRRFADYIDAHPDHFYR